MTLTAQDRARRIKIILFDVDGVLTDGTIWLVPAPNPASSSADTQSHLSKHEGQAGFGVHSATMMEAKGYSAHDGTAISLARLGGMKCGVITKRVSETVATRARDLKLEFVYMGQAFKMQAVREIMAKEGVTLEEIAYVGDDVIDLPVMRECGFAVAVANARQPVKAAWVKAVRRSQHGRTIARKQVSCLVHRDSSRPHWRIGYSCFRSAITLGIAPHALTEPRR